MGFLRVRVGVRAGIRVGVGVGVRVYLIKCLFITARYEATH